MKVRRRHRVIDSCPFPYAHMPLKQNTSFATFVPMVVLSSFTESMDYFEQLLKSGIHSIMDLHSGL